MRKLITIREQIKEGKERVKRVFIILAVLPVVVSGVMDATHEEISLAKESNVRVNKEDNVSKETDKGVSEDIKNGRTTPGGLHQVSRYERPSNEQTNKRVEVSDTKVTNRGGSDLEGIKRFITTYRGSKVDESYLNLLVKNCKNTEIVKNVIAIGLAETALGRDTRNQANFYGWFKGGNRYYDPSNEIMTKEICDGIAKYSEKGMGNVDTFAMYVYGRSFNGLSKAQQGTYTNSKGQCGTGVKGEMCRFNWALKQMN